jgi:uncharacterized repeat protein (TIGR03803 family)
MRNVQNFVIIMLSSLLISACGESPAPLSAPLGPPASRHIAERTPSSVKYSVIYSFKGYPDDGADPQSALLELNGTFYGTTKAGGSNSCYDFLPKGCGTVFAVTASGLEKWLYSFKAAQPGGVNAQLPNNLIDVNGALYGTTSGGGLHYGGTVFTITTSGKERVLYEFGTVTTAFSRARAFSTSTARSTARPDMAAPAITERFLLSPPPARRRFSIALRPVLTARGRRVISSTSTARSTARRSLGARPATERFIR